MQAPIQMILHCPVCHMQHIDEVNEQTNPGWENPPHTSHKCLGCGTVWRPCAQMTEGVAALEEHGSSDTWPALGRRPKPSPVAAMDTALPERACICIAAERHMETCAVHGYGGTDRRPPRPQR